MSNVGQRDYLMNYPDWVGQVIYLEKRQQLVLMAAIALIGLISLGYQAINLKRLISANPITSPLSQTMATHPKPIPKSIASVALFGNPNIGADQIANMKLPTTNLQLTLRGAVVESDESKSSAVIEEPGKPAQSYRVGDNLPGNVTLHSVFSDHVVLKRNGQLETLNFPPTSKLNIKNDSVSQAMTMPPMKPDPEPAFQTEPAPEINSPNAIHKSEPVTSASPESIQERLQQLQQQHEQH